MHEICLDIEMMIWWLFPRFSLLFYAANRKKQQNAVLRYKMGLQNKFDILFEFFGTWLYMAVDILFSISYVLTKLRLFPWFSLLFYAGKRKKQEYAVLGYKKGSKIKSDILFEFFGPCLYMTFDTLFQYHTYEQSFRDFLYCFMKEIIKKQENEVLGYIKESKWSPGIK